MDGMPQDRGIDNTVDLLNDPYRFISARCARLQTDVFETRLMLRRTICMSGRDAAEVFYDDDRLMRHGAAPTRLQKTLLGVHGVQSLDGESHRHRKQMFSSVLSRPRIEELLQHVTDRWREQAYKWRVLGRIRLYEQMQSVLALAACGWAGVPVRDAERRQRTRQLAALFDRAGTIGPKHWSARSARHSTERWIAGLVESVRDGRLVPPPGSALGEIAAFVDADGAPLTPEVAAVELLNLLRPTVALSVFITFTALALHENPGWRDRVARDPRDAESFVQEVRRFYPFFPAAMARVRRDFEWRGLRFHRGRRVLLDLYGTDHDERLWDSPDRFRPERFENWNGDAFSFIPQGGGSHDGGHRCAGERASIEILKFAARALARLRHTVPPQDLTVDFSRLPALPRSGFLLEISRA